jgi:hypothetical protein
MNSVIKKQLSPSKRCLTPAGKKACWQHIKVQPKGRGVVSIRLKIVGSNLSMV